MRVSQALRCVVWYCLFAVLAALPSGLQAQSRLPAAGSFAGPQNSAPARQWVTINGFPLEVAIAPSGDVFALIPEGVFRIPAAALGLGVAAQWQYLGAARFTRVRATHDGTVWALDQEGSLFSYRPSSRGWERTNSNLRFRDVAASPDGQALVISTSDVLLDLYSGKPFEPAPPPSSAPLDRLVVDVHGMPWLQREDRSVVRFDGTAWQPVSTANDQLGGVAAAYDGTIMVIGRSGELLQYLPASNSWQPYVSPGTVAPPLRQLALSPSGVPWGITTNGLLVSERALTPGTGTPPPSPATFTRLLSWRAVGGPSARVSVGEDGTTYVVTPAGGIQRRKRGNEWEPAPAGDRVFEDVAAGTRGTGWALTVKGEVWQFQPGSSFPLAPAINARFISVGQQGTLFAITSDNLLQQWNSRTWTPVTPINERVAAFAMGPRNAPWIVDAEGMVKTFAGNAWSPVPGIKARNVSVGPEGTVYAAAQDEKIYWLDVRERKWKPANGDAVRVAVGPGGAPLKISAKSELSASARFVDEQVARDIIIQNARTRTTTAQSSGSSGGSSSGGFVTGGQGNASDSKPVMTISSPAQSTSKPVRYQTVAANVGFRDVAIGANGAVYAASSDGALMCFNNAATSFVLASAGNVDRVAVAPSGTPWVLDLGGRVSRFESGAWKQVPFFNGVDISVAPDTQIWAINSNGAVVRFNAGTAAFELEPADIQFRARRLAAENGRVYWAVTEQNQLMRCANGKCDLALFGARDVAVAPDNTPFVLDLLGSVQRYNQSKRVFEKVEILSGTSFNAGIGNAIAVGPGGLPWLVTPAGKIDFAGLFNPQSTTVNAADCAGKFAVAAIPQPPKPLVGLVATADTATVDPGASFNLLANDSFAGRVPGTNDVTVSLDTSSTLLTLNGGSVVLSTSATAGQILSGTYRICPINITSNCVSAPFTITVSGATLAPTSVTAVPGNGRATVSFVAPTISTKTVSGYTVRVAAPGGSTASGTSSPISIAGLSNGLPYAFVVSVTFTDGTVRTSELSNTVVPTSAQTVPDAPILGTVSSPGAGQATVSFAAPANTGGASITSYTVTASPGNVRISGTGSPITISGLTPGSLYSFSVTATNTVGTSLPSASSTPIALGAGPGAPTIGTATAGTGQASVTFTAPASTGSSPIVNYTVTSTPGGFTASGTASPITVTGLTNGTAYVFTVFATNANGPGAASAQSNSVTPGGGVPGAPTGVSGVSGPGAVLVSFTAPASPGGSPIIDYTVTSSPGGFTGTAPASPIPVSGLTNGTPYTFTVTARNATGSGPASAASAPVTPLDVPGPVTGVGSAQNGPGLGINVSFTAPASNGGSPIIDYTVSCIDTTTTFPIPPVNGGASPINVTGGVVTGNGYSCAVSANNAVGSSVPVPAPPVVAP